MIIPDGLDPSYVAFWRPFLTGWLGWSEDRFGRWTAAWDFDLRSLDELSRYWFYHEEELYYILLLLVPDRLALRLSGQQTRRMFNDLDELIYEELWPAITGRPHHPSWRTDAFDWGAAKDRVEKVLNNYGESLPDPSEVSSYERGTLEHFPQDRPS